MSLPIQEVTVIMGDEIAQHKRTAGCLNKTPPGDLKKTRLGFLSLSNSRPSLTILAPFLALPSSPANNANDDGRILNMMDD
jgi:hypothetical protein